LQAIEAKVLLHEIYPMNALKNSLEIWRLSSSGNGFRSRLLAFLCARLGNLSEKRRGLRAVIFKLIGCFARNEQINISFRTSRQTLTIFLRQGNRADYLVFGEMVMGGYKVPGQPSSRPTAVIDGGANIGLFSLFAHATFPGIKVTCYEPDKDNLAQLRRNLEANNIVGEVIPKALWSKTAELFFHPAESYSGHVDAEPSPYPISCILPVVPDHSWLKLDIEGAEYEVLPALLNSGCRPKIISMEIHDFNRRGSQLLSLLQAHGYEWHESFQGTEPCVTICAFEQNQ
jgi:FkbM family methyltransferase